MVNLYNCIDWEKHSGANCTKFWKGWDKRFQGNTKVQVKDIGTYVNIHEFMHNDIICMHA